MDLAARAANAAQAGFHGMVNWPTSVLYPRALQQVLDKAGNGFSREVAMLLEARRHGLATLMYVATLEQALRAINAGLEMICLNFGWSPGGKSGVSTRLDLPEVAMQVQAISRAVRRSNPRCLILVEGGPLETAEQVGAILRDTPIDGYVGGSTLERLPIEDSVAARTVAFKSTAKQLAQEKRGSLDLEQWASKRGLVGSSEASINVFAQIRRNAEQAHPVLLWGEDGTPMLALATALLDEADRQDTSVVALRARQLTSIQIEHSLFGSDTGQRTGLLADPDHTLILLGDLERIPRRTQVRIARYLRDGWFSPIGSRRRIVGRARLVLSAQQPPEKLLEASLLDTDLAAVIGAGAIRVPPLRERHDDIEQLLIANLQRMAPMSAVTLDPSARRALLINSWPGNDRQLQELASRLIAGGKLDAITATDIARLTDEVTETQPLNASERERLLQALWRHRFSRQKTADFLGISRKTLYNRMQRHGLLNHSAKSAANDKPDAMPDKSV